jgi:hypothetical protein
MFRSLAKKIQNYSKNYHSEEYDQSRHVHNFCVNVFSTDLVGIIFYKGIRKISLAQFFFYFPLPVCNRAVAPTKPDTQNKPGKCGSSNSYQMSFPGSWPYPTKNVKTDQQEMSKSKQYVEEFEQGVGYCFTQRTLRIAKVQ